MNLFGRRRRILIDKLQLTLLGVSMAHLIMIIAIFLIAVFAPAIFSLYRETSPELSLEAANEFLNLHKRIWPAAGLALLLIAYHSVHVSHRIAGPLYRFRGVFESMAQGDLRQRAGVRRKDYLRQDADAINEMIDGLVTRSMEIRQCAAETQTALADLVKLTAGTADPELSAAIGKLGLRLDRLSESASRTRCPDSAVDSPESTPEPCPAARPHEVGID
jgi:methyl-accepting chemotaxis protein